MKYRAKFYRDRENTDNQLVKEKKIDQRIGLKLTEKK